jgi:hypothetical protein
MVEALRRVVSGDPEEALRAAFARGDLQFLSVAIPPEALLRADQVIE